MYRTGVIRVLIVDDSILFRELVARRIEEDGKIEVVGVAGDPFEARDKILDLVPDVITLDIELPRMDGIEFLKRLMPQYPIPTVVVSSHYESLMHALEAGAVDFIRKPIEDAGKILESFFQEMIVKIKIASMANVSSYKKTYIGKNINSGKLIYKNKVIVIGASTGGTEAIFEIIKSLPSNMPGIVIVQHMPEVFTRMFGERLNQFCPMRAKEAEDGDCIQAGSVLVAPGGFQVTVYKKDRKNYVHCQRGDRVNGHIPSVDVLFHSVADEFGAEAIGVLLTGMGSDGAKGLLAMKKSGAITLGQDEDSCVVYGMPKVAFDMGGVSEQLPLSEIAAKLVSLVNS